VKTALAVAREIRTGGKVTEPETNVGQEETNVGQEGTNVGQEETNVGKEVSPEVTPSQQPTQQTIAAGMTPSNPELPLSVAAVPFAIVLFLCSLIFYGLIRIRFRLVNPRRTLL
jgi:hypothetical protein